MTKRFEVLDSWRGICAILIAIYHFRANSHFFVSKFLSGAYLFVDFFFVLSGFVIAANYLDRLRDGFSVSKFAILRFGRLYPLYLVMLLIFLRFEWELAFNVGSSTASNTETISAFLNHISMLQIFGINDFLSWNYPDWSIAAEFWTCLLFALSARYLRSYFWPVVVLSICISITTIWIFSKHFMNVSFDLGIFRCIAGFDAGVLVFHFYRQIDAIKLSNTQATAAEFAILLLISFFVSYLAESNAALLSPFLFAIAVSLFAKEAGYFSKVLKLRMFLFLGALSYSIYMTHIFVQGRINGFGQLLQMYFGTEVFTNLKINNEEFNVIGSNVWLGDIWTIFDVLSIIAFSLVTYRYIEEPSRIWFRKIAQSLPSQTKNQTTI